jgi:hypothetical protein
MRFRPLRGSRNDFSPSFSSLPQRRQDLTVICNGKLGLSLEDSLCHVETLIIEETQQSIGLAKRASLGVDFLICRRDMKNHTSRQIQLCDMEKQPLMG